MSTKPNGFTIVELLIVIVIIGILAAITTAAFSGIQNKAHDAAVQADLRQIGNIMHANQDEDGHFPSQTPVIQALNIKVATSSYANRNNMAFCVSSTDFGIAAVSKSGNRYAISSMSGGVVLFPTMTTSTGSTCSNMGLNIADLFCGGLRGGTRAVYGRWDSLTRDLAPDLFPVLSLPGTCLI